MDTFITLGVPALDLSSLRKYMSLLISTLPLPALLPSSISIIVACTLAECKHRYLLVTLRCLQAELKHFNLNLANGLRILEVPLRKSSAYRRSLQRQNVILICRRFLYRESDIKPPRGLLSLYVIMRCCSAFTPSLLLRV